MDSANKKFPIMKCLPHCRQHFYSFVYNVSWFIGKRYSLVLRRIFIYESSSAPRA
ncbi:hypothetical protein JCM9152_4556 [Halalkalibacter hemicellulosilyticusJCM 9152]|uniref:Uncharacterized protein n=1 Tax=Halalkalibacter hemicellulosilyticusJCM 9152 TaxID=1236971 RepID=W4QMU4_9BACI|nr:hypothetical protein JCM9152_4556 [Halalkalibacter hemicellulosilyticusJCM 9152]